jgi:hypothetical protein
MRKVIDFFEYKKKKQEPLKNVQDIILKNNHLKTIECLCRVARFHANTVDDYHINASVHCLESIRQEIDDLLDRVKEQGGFLVFDQ